MSNAKFEANLKAALKSHQSKTSGGDPIDQQSGGGRRDNWIMTANMARTNLIANQKALAKFKPATHCSLNEILELRCAPRAFSS